MEQEARSYELPGGQSSAEVHKPFGNNHYYALVDLNGHYPQADKIAHNVGRREYMHLLKGEVDLTINNEHHLLQPNSTKLVDDGDYYYIDGKGKIMVFVEDKDGGITEIKDLS